MTQNSHLNVAKHSCEIVQYTSEINESFDNKIAAGISRGLRESAKMRSRCTGAADQWSTIAALPWRQPRNIPTREKPTSLATSCLDIGPQRLGTLV